MREPHLVKYYTPQEERLNILTHGLGFLLSLAALPLLVIRATVHGNAWHIVSVSVYGSTLILLYSASTLYHSVQNRGLKSIFRILDHSAIYLLIAGTYTPFTLVNLRGPWGWWLFGVIWGIAVLGIVLQIYHGLSKFYHVE